MILTPDEVRAAKSAPIIALEALAYGALPEYWVFGGSTWAEGWPGGYGHEYDRSKIEVLGPYSEGRKVVAAVKWSRLIAYGKTIPEDCDYIRRILEAPRNGPMNRNALLGLLRWAFPPAPSKELALADDLIMTRHGWMVRRYLPETNTVHLGGCDATIESLSHKIWSGGGFTSGRVPHLNASILRMSGTTCVHGMPAPRTRADYDALEAAGIRVQRPTNYAPARPAEQPQARPLLGDQLALF